MLLHDQEILIKGLENSFTNMEVIFSIGAVLLTLAIFLGKIVFKTKKSIMIENVLRAFIGFCLSFGIILGGFAFIRMIYVKTKLHAVSKEYMLAINQMKCLAEGKIYSSSEEQCIVGTQEEVLKGYLNKLRQVSTMLTRDLMKINDKLNEVDKIINDKENYLKFYTQKQKTKGLNEETGKLLKIKKQSLREFENIKTNLLEKRRKIQQKLEKLSSKILFISGYLEEINSSKKMANMFHIETSPVKIDPYWINYDRINQEISNEVKKQKAIISTDKEIEKVKSY